jgi:hypothetical protein
MKKLLYTIILVILAATGMHISAELVEPQEQSFGQKLLKEYHHDVGAAQAIIDSNNRAFTAFFFGSMFGHWVDTKRPIRSIFIFGPACVYTLLALTDLGLHAMDLPYTAVGQESFAQDHPYIAKSLAVGPLVPLVVSGLTKKSPVWQQFVFGGPILTFCGLTLVNAMRTIVNMPYYGVSYGLQGVAKTVEMIDSSVIEQNVVSEQPC